LSPRSLKTEQDEREVENVTKSKSWITDLGDGTHQVKTCVWSPPGDHPVGCGILVTVKDNKIVKVEGDPDHPINRGSLCSKGSALFQIPNNDKRLSKVLYRAPGSGRWEVKSWDWALDKIARNIKDTRDKGFLRTNAKGQVVNRVENIASLGGAGLDNEEVYSLVKFKRALGLVYLEHQARI